MRSGIGFAALALGLAGLGAQSLVAGQVEVVNSETEFDAEAAWDEFEQILRQTYAYVEREDMDVDAQFERSRALARKATDRTAVRRILHRTALTFSDPHLIVGPFEDDDYNIVMTSSDLAMQVDDMRAVIADVRRGSAAYKAGLRPGDEVLLIDGLPALEAALMPYGEVLEQPTALQLQYGLTLAANGKRAGERLLMVRRASTGETLAVTLANARNYAREVHERRPVDLEFVGQTGNVAVLRPNNSLGNNDTIEAFDAALEEAVASGAKAVVLDMRETPSGGNTEVARSIIGHFLFEPRPYQMHRIPAFEREFTVPRQFVEYAMPRAPQFTGPVFVLHGKWTGSMGEGIVIGMDAATDAQSIGSDMGDLLGGLWNYELEESGARLDVGGEALFHVNGTPREDFESDSPMMPASTAEDGSDPAIAEVLRRLENNNREN